jgi:hemolysin III
VEEKRRWIREPFCGLSHLTGAVLSIPALVTLLILAAGRVWHVVGFSIYGASLFLVYLASTLYHTLSAAPHQMRRLQKFDRSAIYLLIAGTYAPICLTQLRGAWGWSLLTAEYVMAAVGVTAVLFGKNTPNWLRVTLYVGMGWLALIALAPLRQVFSPVALAWLLAGGVIYSIGTIVYATDRPHLWPGRFSAHDLWHVFVLGGSACHFVVMLYTV